MEEFWERSLKAGDQVLVDMRPGFDSLLLGTVEANEVDGIVVLIDGPTGQEERLFARSGKYVMELNPMGAFIPMLYPFDEENAARFRKKREKCKMHGLLSRNADKLSMEQMQQINAILQAVEDANKE